MDDQTAGKLAAMTDQGAFERLATAILREANPVYRLLTHQGVNARGKTVKSPLDGILFIGGANTLCATCLCRSGVTHLPTRGKNVLFSII